MKFDLLIILLTPPYPLLLPLLFLLLPFLLLLRFQTFLSCSSRTGESFPLFHVLRRSYGLSLGQLNPFSLYRSVVRVLGIPFPDISKLRDCYPC